MLISQGYKITTYNRSNIVVGSTTSIQQHSLFIRYCTFLLLLIRAGVIKSAQKAREYYLEAIKRIR